MRRTNRTAFTLVELLVVIGIIALLISILLPALNRARAQANMVDCAARMRQIGQAIHIYASGHKGVLPASHDGLAAPANAEAWLIYQKLSRVLGNANAGMRVEDSGHRGIHPVFQDVDTISVPTSSGITVRNTYSYNNRLFPDQAAVTERYPNNVINPSKPFANYRNLGNVQRASEVAAAWDGFQLDWWPAGRNVIGWSAWYTSDGLDNWGWYGLTAHNYVFQKPGYTQYDRPMIPRGLQGDFVYRHMKESSVNLLMLDGHVESRRKGEFRVRDICTNFK